MALYLTEDGTIPVSDRFWSKVRKTPTCWLWVANESKNNGYGVFHYQGRMVGAHRMAYLLAHPEVKLTPQMEVNHLCHVKLCMNPEHLSLESHADNGFYRKGPQVNTTSGYRGVHWNDQKQRWKVTVTRQGKKHHGGFFRDKEEANEAAIALRKKLSHLGDYKEDKYATVPE